ncbi:UDP-N-acetylmuramoyl-L-alanyl-D-glutamate--2,6-diaminopimelate ligase [Rickettsiales endosymbiont of Peranema trichophorum]|uniref:UDP-N-acetylmuramoyl-L-alanyl-D-glutamate--2, 6-diaminopimelate ligase n=1 Tax=Rickettsiales endosymbiont of Peranema trichophorum TaxID=2486577 RepID=UPI001023BA08|nr:UDP-N-acetylmuramoyl-L-alanyl-D-glutamate--2,6-diaminopimelate ligase [Rickettsiales endosymbiont of Peranema trichophorum]RZI45239.1 UDP-N-acetylmuramoyl-L-alanyl-D-glutamate--2,6-diaminopimelate ligase [Rickettsiales endosymbiont of Peranema trichophorum]
MNGTLVTEAFDIANISGMATSIQEVGPGYLYVAIKGESVNGEDFIDEAIKKGAVVIMHGNPSINASCVNFVAKDNVQYVFSKNIRRDLALVAGKYYELEPSKIVGITGTSGKTSVVDFYRQIHDINKIQAASIGTLGTIVNGTILSPPSLTTLDPISLHRTLKELISRDVLSVALEVSSHGLQQYRVDGVDFTACAFTNFSQDHLDYHNDMESYFAAKMRLFQELLSSGKSAILNKDIAEFDEIKNRCQARGHHLITYGRVNADITFQRLSDGMLTLNVFGVEHTSHFKPYGDFQCYNLACAIGLVLASGMDVRLVFNAIGSLVSADGRLEEVATHNGARIFIDYAHKPDALEKVLTSARNFTTNRLHVLFGCGGNRDKFKRSIMGDIACELADIVIVTDDNPRNELPAQIRRDIIGRHSNILEISDRAEAIRVAIQGLKNGDVLIITGKGHEKYQIVQGQHFPFCDKNTILKVVSDL